MKISRSPAGYQRMKRVRSGVPDDDRPMTSTPRYGQKTSLSTRKAEKRLERWIKYA